MMQRILLVLTLLLAVPPAGLAQQDAQDKLPVPAAEARQKALALVGEIYKAEYDAAKDPAGKQALARKLLQAADGATDPTNRFALLKVARNVAAGAGDLALAFEAVDTQAAAYQTTPLPLKVEALEMAVRSAASVDAHKAVVDAALALLAVAVERDDFELATRLGRFAVSAARKARDPRLVNRVVARNRKTEKTARTYAKVKVAEERLDADPTDPAPNLVVGRYLCLVKGDWERGVAMLALGDDQPLKIMAIKELRGADSRAAQLALADGWWELAAKESGTPQDHMRQRARHWYIKALPGLEGLVKAKVEQRLEVEKPEPVVEKPKTPEHYLAKENIKNVAFVAYDPGVQSSVVDAIRAFGLQKTASGYRLVLHGSVPRKNKGILFPKEDVFSRKLVAVMTVERGECHIGLLSKKYTAGGTHAMIPPGRPHRLEVWIDKGLARASLDGKQFRLERNHPRHYGHFILGITDNTVVLFRALHFEELE